MTTRSRGPERKTVGMNQDKLSAWVLQQPLMEDLLTALQPKPKTRSGAYPRTPSIRTGPCTGLNQFGPLAPVRAMNESDFPSPEKQKNNPAYAAGLSSSGEFRPIVMRELRKPKQAANGVR